MEKKYARSGRLQYLIERLSNFYFDWTLCGSMACDRLLPKERGREKWELRRSGLDRATWDAVHPGPLSYDVRCDYIDSWGRYHWRVTSLDAERMYVHIKARTASQEIAGCDACVQRHVKTRAHCSANRPSGTVGGWLATAVKPASRERFILYDMDKTRTAFPGVWEITEIIGDDGRHRSFEATCRRVGMHMQ